MCIVTQFQKLLEKAGTISSSERQLLIGLAMQINSGSDAPSSSSGQKKVVKDKATPGASSPARKSKPATSPTRKDVTSATKALQAAAHDAGKCPALKLSGEVCAATGKKDFGGRCGTHKAEKWAYNA